MDSETDRGGSARIVTYVRAQWRSYAVGLTALVITNVCAAGLPYLTKRVFDVLQGVDAAVPAGGQVRAVGLFVGMMVGLAVVMACVRVVSRVYIFDGGRHGNHFV